MNNRKLFKITNILLVISLVCFIAGKLFSSSFFGVGPILSEQSSGLSWQITSVLSTCGLFIGVALLVSRGIWKIRINGFALRNIDELILGLFIATMFIAMLIMSNSLIEQALELSEYKPAINIEQLSDPGFSSQERYEFSFLLAKSKYMSTGEISQYYDPSGNLVDYVPTGIEKDDSEKIQKEIEEIEFYNQSFNKILLLWELVLIIGLFAGFVIPIDKMV